MLGSLLAVGGNLLGGFLNNRAADSRQEDQQAFNAEQFATRYQTTVKDMQAAGLNPMLAYSQGAGSGATSGIASSPGYGELGSSFTQARLASAQMANIHADTENKQAQSANIRADTMLKVAQEAFTGASADQARANIGYLEAKGKSIVESIKNIPKEGDRLDALVKNLGAEFQLIKERTHNVGQATEQLRWLAIKTMLEGDLLNYDIKAVQALDNLGRESAQLRPVIEMLVNVLRSMRGSK